MLLIYTENHACAQRQSENKIFLCLNLLKALFIKRSSPTDNLVLSNFSWLETIFN